MSTPLQISFIRHGETEWSLSGRHTGRTDVPLTHHGQAMARELSATLGGIAFSQVLTSPRIRARATCELAGLGAHARTDHPHRRVIVLWNAGAGAAARSV